MRIVLMVCISIMLCACNATTVKPKSEKYEQKDKLDIKALGKSDINSVLDMHVRQARNYCKELMIKLYNRNPRELKKSSYSVEENLQRLFNKPHDWTMQESEGIIGIDAIRLTFRESYDGDRVFSFVTGLYSMIMASYGYKKDFYMFDKVEPQKLYNSARNIEIALWLLSHETSNNGEPYLFSNSLPEETVNLSFERLFGKLIAVQDTIALIMEGKTRRLINKVIQKMATAVFLPI